MADSAEKAEKVTEPVASVNGGKKAEYEPALKKPQKITCSKSTALLLFLIALASVILSSFVTFWITKGIYDHSMDIKPLMDEAALESSTLTEQEAFDDEPEGDEPTAAELRLPKNLSPLWYNITLKTFLPGYVELPSGRNLTFDAALIVKFRVNEATNKIVMNAVKLNFSDNMEKYKLLQSNEGKSVPVKRFRRADIENGSENATETEPTEDEEEVTDSPVEEDEEQSTSEAPLERPNTTKERTKPVKVAAHAQVKNVIVNETVEMVIFELDDELRPDEEYYFQLLYTGLIDNKLFGLYLSQYTDDAGNRRYAAVTHMEPTDARRMVPCFDEPEFKAVWKVKVIHPSGTVAISNGIELKNAVKSDNPNWVVTTFKETLPMSSYLLALAVTDFEFNEGKTNRGTRFRIWSRKEAINQTVYALESGIKALEFYEDFYEIPFPLEKQDMIALPDFAVGAMENWGLVTYRERYLLYDSRLYSPMQKASVAIVVAHELAHQWFGNLVTMKWWNDLWLNEGFATFMEYLGADAISQGNFRMGEYFLIDAVDAALRRDARASSHPLYFPIDKAEDVSEAFDDITYEKGASIIHMIEDVMGVENFKKGLTVIVDRNAQIFDHGYPGVTISTNLITLSPLCRAGISLEEFTIYLNRYRLSNAAHNDLWSALNEAVPDTLLAWNGEKLDIQDFASKWTEQMGYPVVEVRRLDPKRIELHQKRFKWDDNSLEKEKFRNAKFWYKYDIPIWYEINGEEKPMEWLHEDSAQGVDLKPDELLVVNSGARGFYRVNYNAECWHKIIDQLLDDHNKIDVRSRARIIDDAFALAEAGHISYEIPLNISMYLPGETEFLPWTMAFSGFGTILSNFDDEPEVEEVREFLDSLVAPLYEHIDWDKLNISYLDEKQFFENELDYNIIRQYCAIRNIDCTERLVNLFKTNLLDACEGDEVLASECGRVPIPVRAIVYCEGVKQSAEKTWNKMFELYQRERVQVERDRLLVGLTCSRDTLTLKKLLNLASNLNDTSIRLQDAPTVFRSISGRGVGSKIIFDYFQDNFPRLYKELREQQTLLRRIIASGTNVRGDRKLSQLEAFIKKHKRQTSKLDIFEQQLEVSKTNTLWLNRNFELLTQWFKKQNEQQRMR